MIAFIDTRMTFMLFLKEEKVFSLAKTVAAVPYGDITALFSEFYCYLLVTGLFREGEGIEGVHFTIAPISDKQFMLPSGGYRYGLASMLSKGLKDRYTALWNHPDLTSHENSLLIALNAIFTDDKAWYTRLTGRDLLSVAFSRNFNEDMTAIAHYVAIAFGQFDYPQPVSVPQLYLSVFGNIHLRKPSLGCENCPTHLTTLEEPQLRYGAMTSKGDNVTALWALLSAQITSLVKSDTPGNDLGDLLSGLTFLTERSEFERSIPVPVFSSSLYIQRLMGLDGCNPVPVSAAFYKEFLYGTTETVTLSRQSLLEIILNLMMEKMGESRLDHLFTSNSFYTRLTTTTKIHGKSYIRPAILQFALEALEPIQMKEEDFSNDSSEPSEDTTTDPQGDDGGYDPSAPSPLSLNNDNATSLVTDKNTIGLISFDKSGEGVDEDLYRSAVVALNDRLRSDDTLPLSADVKESLDYWVNGYLYRTAISATKDQIATLNLQQYLKTVLTKG